jgi:hypothetical protein
MGAVFWHGHGWILPNSIAANMGKGEHVFLRQGVMDLTLVDLAIYED